MRLQDKVCVVTGSSRGIGAAIARAYAREGATVAVTYHSAKQEGEAVARDCGAELCLPLDVCSRESIRACFGAVAERHGRIDVLVNNAGGAPPREALRTSESMFEEALRFNVTSAFLLSRLCIPRMLDGDGGTILNISSAAGRLVQKGFVAYGTAKAALSFMTRQLAAEFAPRVRVNALAVGAVETSALAPFLNDELRGAMEARTPMGRIGQVEDIALAALYLASPASSWVTGKVFEVDGGTETTNWPFD